MHHLYENSITKEILFLGSQMKYLFFFFTFFTSLAALENPTIYPPSLEKGDLIAIVFPASFLKNKNQSQQYIDKKVAWLKKQGYRTICYPVKISPVGYLAGTDRERAHALMSAWRNKEVKAIWCYRGGYGTCRILDLLDYEWIKEHPKILLGMSDITALHHAIQQKTGLVTFLAPNLKYFNQSWTDFDDNYSLAQLEKIAAKGVKDHIAVPEKGNQIKVIKHGRGEGKFIGGNLTLVASLCGTKWQLDTRGKILVLEEVGEEVFRIDRMLWQLKESGLLKSPAGVILGRWVACKSTASTGLSLEDVLKQYFADAKYPVILDFPTGHSNSQTTIPLNVYGKINTANKQVVQLLEPAVMKTK